MHRSQAKRYLIRVGLTWYHKALARYWWSDVFTMDEHFRDIRTRRDEPRGAVNFNKKAFQEMDTFSDFLFTDSGKLVLVGQFQREDVPGMYQLD